MSAPEKRVKQRKPWGDDGTPRIYTLAQLGSYSQGNIRVKAASITCARKADQSSRTKAKQKDQISQPMHAAPLDLGTDSISVGPPGQIVAYDVWTVHAEEVEALRRG